MIRPTLTDLNPVELNYHQFLISLDKRSGSCNLLITYLQKYAFQVKQKK